MNTENRITITDAANCYTLPWLGGPMWLPLRSAQTAGRLSLQYATVPPGGHNPPHCHGREDEFFYVVDGRVDLRCGPHALTLGPGDLAYAPRGLPHQLSNVTDRPATLVVGLSPGDVEAAFVEASEHIGQGRPDDPTTLAALRRAFEPRGVVFLDHFDPSFVHPDVPDAATRAPIVRAAAEGPAVFLAGDRYTVKLSGDETGDRFALVYFDVYPAGGPLPHIHHREEEAFLILEGELDLWADGRFGAATGKAGDLVFLPRDIPHAFRNATDKVVRMLVLTAPAGFDRMVLEVGQPAVPGRTPPRPNHAEIQRLLAAAPKYGLEILPPPSAT